MTQSGQQTITIADLLSKARLISQDQLARAIATSIRTNAPIGSVLVQNGVPIETMRTAGLAHQLVVENLIAPELASEAISRAVAEKISLEEALDRLGWRSDFRLVTGRLRQILIESGTVKESDLNNAVEASYASGLPLGRVLVVRRVVPEAHAYAALTAQVLIREGRITAQQGIEGLKLAYKEHTTIEEALSRIGALPLTRTDPIRLGELLISAGLVTEIDLLSAVEKGMSHEMPIGQVLLKHGLLQQQILDRALTLQFMINNRSMTPAEGVAQLQKAAKTREGDIGGQAPINDEQPTLDDNMDFPPDSAKAFGIYKKEDWMRTIQELTLDKQNLAYKVVSQQEEMKYRLARELHDTIIADLMMLKRYLGGDKQLSTEEIIEIVDHIVMQLRDICSDFAPRNFKEWGLQMTLKDLLDRMSERTGIKVVFACDEDLPELPDPVGLHVFRIIQEGLNNMEKYSGASEVKLRIERPEKKLLRFVLSDNGKGFTGGTRSDSAGGQGMGGMKERADLIRCFYPVALAVDSAPGAGSTVTLEIEIPGSGGERKGNVFE